MILEEEVMMRVRCAGVLGLAGATAAATGTQRPCVCVVVV